MTNRHPEIVLPEDELRRDLKARTRRGFLVGGVASALGIAGYMAVRHTPADNNVPGLQRKILDMNGRLAHDYLSDSHQAHNYRPNEISNLKPNGDIGMDDEVDNVNWKVQVQVGEEGPEKNALLADIKSLPAVEMTTKFCCIEGWSTVTNWKGVRFSDFTRKLTPSDSLNNDYVYMTTPSEDYYVGLDMKSAMHPQTLLAYEQNGKPLEDEHGSPLRLVIPVKYGIKNIKRLGSIQYVKDRPADYWYERGYDWFAGL